MSYETARPYLAVFVLVKQEGKIASVLRSQTSWMNGYYGLPSGKVEIGESATDAVIRETKEEIGIALNPKSINHVLTMHRQNKGDHAPEWIDIIFECTDWEGEPFNAEPDKHSELAWLDPKNLPDNVVPAVRAVLEAIQNGQQYAEFGW